MYKIIYELFLILILNFLWLGGNDLKLVFYVDFVFKKKNLVFRNNKKKKFWVIGGWL